MAQPTITTYFNTRKRPCIEDHKINSAKKVLILDEDSFASNLLCKEKSVTSKQIVTQNNNDYECLDSESLSKSSENKKEIANANNLTEETVENQDSAATRKAIKTAEIKETTDGSSKDIQEVNKNVKQPEQTKKDTAPALNEIKKKLTKSSRLAELKASISAFNQKAKQLKEAEERTAKLTDSPKIKNFKSIELEVNVSPQKVLSPEKPYLSPRKDTSARRNLINILSPTKNVVALPSSPSKQILETTSKPALTLPYKYKYLAEIFRSIDTVTQILFNRKETITFRKLKPAVEDMLKRNLTLKHISQIKQIYPEAYNYHQEKLRVYGIGIKQEQWELVLTPCIDNKDFMSADILLTRRREMFNRLIEKVKVYHNEFLLTLDPPMHIALDKLTRWHPEFNIEKLPDIEQSDVPQPPIEEKLTTGKEVLEKAREMFNCNTRMQQALERLKAAKESNPELVQEKPVEPTSVLKGIPKALLEKVRQKQAAKALLSMTRSPDKEKEIQLYSRLPEIARLTRSVFVSEKKGVLALETVIEKLESSYRSSLNKTEMEEHLKVIAKEVPTWLIFHDIRHTTYLKLTKNADLSLILSKLENLAKEKNVS